MLTTPLCTIGWFQKTMKPDKIKSNNKNSTSIIIELDANSKLGPEYILNDPKAMSPNGRILGGIVERHALIVANDVKEKSHGVITRKRTTINNSEESVIDLVVISNDLFKSLVSMNVDEERIFNRPGVAGAVL